MIGDRLVAAGIEGLDHVLEGGFTANRLYLIEGNPGSGKTTLLRALTGIDADRLPEERRRGMTIDVGYAHLTLPDGTELDFVDIGERSQFVEMVTEGECAA